MSKVGMVPSSTKSKQLLLLNAAGCQEIHISSLGPDTVCFKEATVSVSAIAEETLKEQCGRCELQQLSHHMGCPHLVLQYLVSVLASLWQIPPSSGME